MHSRLELRIPPVPARVVPEALASALARLLSSGIADCKADLVRVTGLSRTTIDSGLRSLMASGLVIADGTRHPPGRGRPVDVMTIDPAFGSVFVAVLGPETAMLGVFDLGQQELAAGRLSIDIVESPEQTLGRLVEEFQRLADSAAAAPPLVVVVGVAGSVDREAGTVIRPREMSGWTGFPLAEFIADRLGCRALVENDAYLGALGEARSLSKRDGPLVYVTVDSSIGSGIVTIDGELLRGTDGAAGDIGHLDIGTGKPCTCGKTGCLDTVASTPAIIARWRAAAHRDSGSIDDLAWSVARGDADATAAVREAARQLGSAVAMIVQVVNPERVVLAGPIATAGDELLAGVRATVYQDASPQAAKRLAIGLPSLGNRSSVLGAMVVGVEHVISERHIAYAAARRRRTARP